MIKLTQNWLFALPKLIQGITRAVVFLDVSDNGSFTPIAYWPEQTADYQDLFIPAKNALAKGKCILQHNKGTGSNTGEPLDVISCPMILDEQPYAVIVIQLSSRTAAKQQIVIQQIKAATRWFEVLVHQHSSTEKDQLVTIVELVASCLEHERFNAAATDVLTDLTTRFLCDRISIGFLNGQAVHIEAISHSAAFDSRSNLIRGLGEAMEEAIDQNSIITYPEATNTVLLTRCHAAIVEHGIGNILTIPFVANGKISGAILIESPSDRPLDQSAKEHFEQIVLLIGPVLAVRRRDEQLLPYRIRSSFRSSVVKLSGSDNNVFRLSLTAIILCFIVLLFMSGNYRITGDARLEAKMQRLVVTPQDGYISTANVRPGDIVQSGDILGSLDNTDLNLEHRKWASQLEQLQTEYRDALAKHNRSKVSIIKAKMAQAEAQLNLVNEQLTRIHFTAPFDGLVVSGDLSQNLGSPAERGQVLFTVAPLNAYRIILKIDERDISNIKAGQVGNLILSSMPAKPLLFTVEKIVPVSTPEGGRNYFQVEGKMSENSDLLRPGMEGVAKINISDRKLIWIWSHKAIDWLRLVFWSALP